jgi:transposase
MIQITPHMKIFLAYGNPDFRCGIDGLAAVCKEQLKQDPFSGALFVFRNRKGTTIKALLYDGQGFWLMMKRLSSGKFHWWPRSPASHSLAHQQLAAHELQILLWNGDPNSTSVAAMWRPLPMPPAAVA